MKKGFLTENVALVSKKNDLLKVSKVGWGCWIFFLNMSLDIFAV